MIGTEAIPTGKCLNCGAEAPDKFCPQCGQSTRTGVPTVLELIQDTLSATISYDSKLWRTVGTLVRHPGQLTLDYFAGKRATYLSPFQVLFWLEAIAFLAHRQIFSNNGQEADAKARFLLLLGCLIAVGLSLIYVRRNLGFVFHLVAAVHMWAFLMLWLLIEYAVVPVVITVLIRLHMLHGTIPEGQFVTVSTEVAMSAYGVVAIHRTYRVSWLFAVLQMAALFAVFTAVTAWAGTM
jgi:hypothetical protein